MRRRSRAGGEPVKTRRRKAMTLKRGNAPKVVRRRNPSAAGRKQRSRVTRELHDALEQQTATSEVLRVICRSPVDLQTVLDTLVQHAARMCEAEIANIWRPEDGVYRIAASSRSNEYLENHGISGDCRHRTQPTNGHRKSSTRRQDCSRA